MPFAMPAIRLKGFDEHSVIKPVRGALIEEEVRVPLDEPLVPRLRRWLDEGGHIVFAPTTAHACADLTSARCLGICHTILSVRKSETVQLLYGT